VYVEVKLDSEFVFMAKVELFYEHISMHISITASTVPFFGFFFGKLSPNQVSLPLCITGSLYFLVSHTLVHY